MVPLLLGLLAKISVKQVSSWKNTAVEQYTKRIKRGEHYQTIKKNRKGTKEKVLQTKIITENRKSFSINNNE